MSKIKKVLMLLIFVLMLASLAAGVFWHREHYVMVDFSLYPKDLKSLDLREEAVSIGTYQKLTKALPGCEIHWNVPFQNTAYPQDVTEITVTTLQEKDLEALNYLPKLKTVRADQCREYDVLAKLKETYPHLQVEYSIVFSDGSAVALDAKEAALSSVQDTDAQLLQYLPKLKRVVLTGAGDLAGLDALRGTAHNMGLDFGVSIGDQVVLDTQTDVELPGLKDKEVRLLELLPVMQTLHVKNPETAAGSLEALRHVYPNVKITWEVDIAGQTFDDSVTEVDLSTVEVKDLAEVERQMAYLPEAEKLTLGLCGLDDPAWGNSKSEGIAVCEIENEEVAAFRDRVRDQYKVAWTVRVGPNIALRTDVDNFMPGHFAVGRLFNAHAYNLRYCEDMVTLDIGHMTLSDVSFLEFMPKLRHLILAWTEVQSIEPIRNCKELVFLELDNSCVRDYSPLKDCTALQDLNIGKTYADIAPVLEMTWLDNLYMIFCSTRSAYTATQTLTDTNVVASGSATVASGWRHLQNYFDMRDNLGMPYMDW